MTWMDIVAWFSLVLAIVALALTIYGIYDVRKQVRDLVELHGNMLCAELVPQIVRRFVVPTKIELDSAALQKFLMVQRTLFPKEYDEEQTQLTVNRQGLWLADHLVERGLAEWKPWVDLERVKTEIAKAASDTSSGRIKSLFGDRAQGLF